MTLSSREKNLIILLTTAIVVGLYINYLFLPQFDQKKELEVQKDEKVQLVNEIKEYANPNSPIHSEFNNMMEKIKEESREFFPELNQERLILVLDKMMIDSNLKTTNIIFGKKMISEPEAFREEARKNQEFPLKDMSNSYRGKKVEVDSDKKTKEVFIEKMEVNIQAEGSYESTIDFMNRVENYRRKIHISRIDLKNNNQGQITSTIILHFYGVPKLIDQDEDYLVWKIFDVYGRDNPFRP